MAERPIGDDELQAWIDDRLTPDRAAAVDDWLAANPAAAARARRDRGLRRQLRQHLAPKLAEPIPPRLRIANLAARRRDVRRSTALRAAASVALVAAGAVGGWLAKGELAPLPEPRTANDPPPPGLTADALVAHRMFVTEPRHAVEVGAAEEEHLIRWLSNRLGRPLRAPNLAAQGFRLMGGRLLPGSPSGPAAQLIYVNAEGVRLTVYLRPTGGEANTEFRSATAGDVNAFWWTDRGFGYAISAPVGRERLLPIAQAVFDELAASAR